MPERLSPQWWISALTSVPVQLPAPRMHDQSGRLVDDDQLVVLIKNVERDGLALRGGGFGLRHGDLDLFAGRQLAFRFARCHAVDENRALSDEGLHAAA